MTTKRPSRKQARRDALFLLYQHEVTPFPMETLRANLEQQEGYPVDEFTVRLVDGVLARREELDRELAAHSEHWALERIAPLERSVLRLALFELAGGETPPEVAIDEAVRLAKRYATDEAGALVNGILAGILRQRQAAAGEGA